MLWRPQRSARRREHAVSAPQPLCGGQGGRVLEVANYREAYDLFGCSGILFNHESPLRPERFVTRKVIAAACRIASGSQEPLTLGDLGIVRDWGWAPEYVEAIWLMLQQSEPDDYVVATGQSRSLQDFVETAFWEVGLDWRRYVVSDTALARPNELRASHANPGKAHLRLGWKAKYGMQDVVRMMVDAQRQTSDSAGGVA